MECAVTVEQHNKVCLDFECLLKPISVGEEAGKRHLIVSVFKSVLSAKVIKWESKIVVWVVDQIMEYIDNSNF